MLRISLLMKESLASCQIHSDSYTLRPVLISLLPRADLKILTCILMPSLVNSRGKAIELEESLVLQKLLALLQIP